MRRPARPAVDNPADPVDGPGDTLDSPAISVLSAWCPRVTDVTGPSPAGARLLTAADVCQLLNISKSTIQAWRDAGALEAVPLPLGGWRYPSNQEPIRRALEALGRGTEVAR